MAVVAGPSTAYGAEPHDRQRFEIYAPHPSGVAITNALSGVVCLDDGDPSRVCAPTYTVPIVGDAVCEWSEDVDYPCTWYGYQFDIRNLRQAARIVCDVTNSIRTNFGPQTENLTVTGNNTAQYTIDLEPDQDHLFHPAYHTYAPVERETSVISVHACRIGTALLYQASFRAFYQAER